jgi:hypothetical protein
MNWSTNLAKILLSDLPKLAVDVSPNMSPTRQICTQRD